MHYVAVVPDVTMLCCCFKTVFKTMINEATIHKQVDMTTLKNWKKGCLMQHGSTAHDRT